MKKYIFILLAMISFWSCDHEDRSIDTSVLPLATSTGADTFGCLVDGWVYVGGRYLGSSWGWGWSGNYTVWPHDSFVYYEKSEKHDNADILLVSVDVKPGINVDFTIIHPQEGKPSTITSVRFDGDELDDGTAFITRFDTKRKIISGTFGNGNLLTNGRFDVHYSIGEDINTNPDEGTYE